MKQVVRIKPDVKKPYYFEVKFGKWALHVNNVEATFGYLSYNGKMKAHLHSDGTTEGIQGGE